MINCKQATELSVKRSESPLNLKARFQLSIHLLFCVYCRKFDQQVKALTSMLRSTLKEEKLNQQEREELQRIIDNQTNATN